MPAHWQARTRDIFEAVIEEIPDLQGAALATLFEAAELSAAADLLDAYAREHGPMSVGSQGQPTVSPAMIEARLSRTASAAILKSLRTDAADTRSTKARRAARVRHGRTGTAS
ncbi:hypothetical protein V6K52_10095 [Knoellia sp. S7-12]|uniref:hypothetical protein n=1 Tax=Knoellia sp. S7-12 TaxID=3126698 RepID=UPI0033686C9F